LILENKTALKPSDFKNCTEKVIQLPSERSQFSKLFPYSCWFSRNFWSKNTNQLWKQAAPGS